VEQAHLCAIMVNETIGRAGVKECRRFRPSGLYTKKQWFTFSDGIDQ
jgi:hypothetical protein